MPPVGIRGAKGPLALKLVVTNPEICVLESPEQEDSRGLMVRAKIDVSYLTLDPIVGGGQKARILMRSFELCKRRFSCNELKAGWCVDATSVVLELADKDTEVALLEPLDMQLFYSQVNYPAEMCEVVIEVQRVYVTLSIQDYKLLMNLVDIAREVYQEQLAKEPAAEATEETEQPSPDVAAKGDDNMQENFEKEQELQLVCATYTHIHTHTHTHTRTHTHTHTHTHAHTYTYTSPPHTHTLMYTFTVTHETMLHLLRG